MKKYVLTFGLVFGFVLANAQILENITLNAGYTDKVFYSLSNGSKTSIANNNWDIALATYSIQTASIRINAGFGVELYQYEGGDTTQWATFDTTGFATGTNFIRCHDSHNTFEPSAFESQAQGHPNYGWGVYNSITHNVVGVKLYLLKTTTGNYKKVWIKGMNAMANKLDILVADIDGSNQHLFSESRSIGSKNYLYINVETNAVLNVEPNNTEFDLIFAKYETDLGGGIFYPVTGVLTNRKVEVAEARNVEVGAANYTQFTFSNNMDVIGSDWKTFNNTTFQFELADSLSFFVKDIAGNIYHVWFTHFEGTATGNIEFEKQLVLAASNNEVMAKNNDIKIYPNPATNQVYFAFNKSVINQNLNIQIIDLTGKQVLNKTVITDEGSQIVGLNLFDFNLNKGIYLVTTTINNTTNTQKLVVH